MYLGRSCAGARRGTSQPPQVQSDVQPTVSGDTLLAGQVAYRFARSQRNQRVFIISGN